MYKILPLALLLATPALASSDEAWIQFRADVQTACLAKIDGPGTPAIEVNPFGSEKFGVAIITLTNDLKAEQIVCIYDKQTKTAELTGPFE